MPLAANFLDQNFGNDGKTLIDFNNADGAIDIGRAALAADGKVVIVGRSSVGTPGSGIGQGAFVARMLANGEPDPTFGVGGRSALDDIDQLAEAVVLNNGSIVAVGSIKNANNDLAIIKLTNSGKLDLNFGADGVSLIDFGDEEFGTSITLDASGNVYAIGVAFNAGTNADIGIAKLDRTGNLDTTFGVGGRLKVDLAGVADFAADGAIDNRGRLVVAGLTGSALNEAFVIRLVAAGTGQLDVNFSGDGKTVVSGTWGSSSLSLGIAANDQIFVGGATFDGAGSQSSATVIKLASNGTLLAGFGNAGRFNFNAEVDSQDGIGSLLIDDRGRLLVLANSASATDRRQSLTLAAIDATSGNLIRSFGPSNDGLSSIRYFGYRSYRPVSLLQRGGQLIAQGTSDNNLSLTQLSLGDGIVDTGFGNSGHRLIDFSSLFGSDDQFVNMVVQSDGKIITLANIDTGGNRYAALTRTNSDGTLDSTFAFDGRLVLSRLEDADDIELIGERIYVLADDKLLAKPTVVRLFGDGDVDRNYGISGYADVSTVGRGKSLAVANGKVFVGGTSFNGANDDFAVVKLDSFGNVDSSFSGDGLQTVNFANQPDSLSDLKIDQAGRLLLVGSTISTTNSDVAIARLLPNGTLDNNFSGGRVVRDISGISADDDAVELEAQPTGSYIVAGKTSVAGLEESFLLRLSENGQPLTEFDSDGKVIIDLSGSGEDDELTGIELAPNGQIYVTGKAEIDSGVRLLTRTSFAAFNATTGAIIRNLNPSTGGRVLLTASNYSTSRGAAIKVLSDRVVIGSSISLNSNLSNLTLHAFQIGSALPVANFGSAGVTMVDFVNVGENTTGTSERLTSLDVNRAGESILAGVAANASTMFGTLAKLNDAGKLDNRFAHNGLFIDKRFQDGFDDAKYLPNGKILVLGKINNEFALLQLNPDGQIDLTYGNRGLALSNFPTVAVPSRLAIDANGRAVVVGSIVTATGGDFAVARFDRTGNLDGQFSGDGMLTIDLTGLSEDGIDIATDPNGRIWLSGSVDGANSKFGVVRVNSSGVLDIGFDGDGIGTYDANPGSSISETFRSMQLFPDGTLAIAGEADTSFRIVRINANGSLRSGFGTNGVVNTNIGPDAALGELALDSEGRLIAAGRVGLNHLSRVVLVGYDASTGATSTGFGDANGQNLLDLFGVESVTNRVRINGANSKLTIAASSSRPDNLIVTRLEPGAPVLVVASQANYRENQSAVNLSPFASVSDSDSVVFGGGVLTVQNTNSKPSDVISIKANATVTVSGVQVRVNNVAIGSVITALDNSLQIRWNQNATLTRVRSVLRAIAFSNRSDTPQAGRRQIRWLMTDGTGGESEVVKTTVTVTPINDAPRVIIPQTELAYLRNQSSVSVAKTAIVTDVDNIAFNNGRLSLQFTTGRSAVNRLSIEGGAFTVDASSRLRRNGIVIGKVLSNGIGLNPLVIEFAVNSTVRDIQNLLRSVTFSTVGSTSTDNQIRTLTVSVVDPLKAISPLVSRKIKLVALT